jgi:hypothetical protein
MRARVKNRTGWIRFFLLVSAPCLLLRAQSATEEELLENGTETAAPETLERLDEWKRYPLNINDADAGEIAILPVVSPSLAKIIVRERRENGPFLDETDLRKRIGLDRAAMEALAQWTVFIVPGARGTWKAHARIRAQNEFPKSDGFRNDRYAGSPLQACQRADFNIRDRLLGAFFIEKDPGETRWHDETAGYLQFRNASRTFRLTAGRFNPEAGRGLVLWSTAGLFRGSDPAGPVRGTSSSVRGVASSGMNSALSGGALEWRTGFFRAMACVSKARVDASLDSNGGITSVHTTGLHRTASETEDRNAVEESVGGVHLQAGPAGLRIGASGLWTRYGGTVRAADPDRRPFGFTGRANWVAGTDWDVSFGPLNVTGEIARSRSGGTAWTVGFSAESGGILFAISFRRYDPDFQNPRASGFGSGMTQNETGCYWGLTHRVSERTRIGMFSDLFRSPAKTWLIPVPSNGAEWMVTAEHDWSNAATIRVKARIRDGMRMETLTVPAGADNRLVTDRSTRSLRLELELRPGPGLKLRSRIETVKTRPPEADPASDPPESGVLFFEEMAFRKSERFRLTLRWATFDTDSYDSRVVVVENDLPGGAALIPLYQKGHRWTVVLRWRAAADLAVILKFGATMHAFADSWGSGNDRIPGNLERKIGIQMDWNR